MYHHFHLHVSVALFHEHPSSEVSVTSPKEDEKTTEFIETCGDMEERKKKDTESL
jgi:hypothetical protein